MDTIGIQANSEHGLRNAGGVINRGCGARGWHMARVSGLGLGLGEGEVVSVTPTSPRVERRPGPQAGEATPQWRAPTRHVVL